jgi:hypothetical protein
LSGEARGVVVLDLRSTESVLGGDSLVGSSVLLKSVVLIVSLFYKGGKRERLTSEGL